MPDKDNETYSQTEAPGRRAAITDEHIDRHLALHVEREVTRQLESLNLTKKAWGEVRELQQGLKLHHKIAYGTMVFLGGMLLWYGTWTAFADIPILKNPAVAFVSGIALLAFTGVLYNKLTG